MKKQEITRRLNDAVTELVGFINMYNKSQKDIDNFLDFQTAAEAQEAISAFENSYDDNTEYLASDGTAIKIGDELDILSDNIYDGLVNLKEGVICLETAFFNKPLSVHIADPNIEFCLVRKDFIDISDDKLPF